MLANALVLPYSLRVHEDRDQADVQETLQSTAQANGVNVGSALAYRHVSTPLGGMA